MCNYIYVLLITCMDYYLDSLPEDRGSCYIDILCAILIKCNLSIGYSALLIIALALHFVAMS